MPLFRFDYIDDIDGEPLTAYVESPSLDFAFAVWHRETGLPARTIDTIAKVGSDVWRSEPEANKSDDPHGGCMHPDYCVAPMLEYRCR